MVDVVERVAEAIRLRSIERGHPVHPVMVRHLAVAAIEAMREPTPEMVTAGNWLHERDGIACYRAMLSAAIPRSSQVESVQ